VPPEPPVPIAAEWVAPILTLIVTFSRPLLVGLVDPTNWGLKYDGRRYEGDYAQISSSDPTKVLVDMVDLAAALPGRTCSYQPPPYDVVAQGGPPAAAFAAYPVP
jgi:hypothetical protein